MTEEQAYAKLKDKEWRLSHLYKIKTKEKKLVRFKPKPAQLDYLVNASNRDIILKARQLGFSTLKLIELLDYAIFNPNANCAVIAHQRDTVQTLFEIVRLAYDNLPDGIRPRPHYNNRNEIYFPDTNSKISVALDVRGETIHNLHVSELAHLEHAEEKMLGILEAVPKSGIISFESTANGMSGYFYEVWEDKKSEFRKHFYNWTWDPDYQEDGTNLSFDDLVAEYIPLQVKYNLIPEVWSKFNLTKGQLKWYIDKAIRHREMIVQEYPTNPLEAFIASGRNVFHIQDLQKHDMRDPIDRKYGDLLIWEKPLAGFKYVIGCDPSEGIGGDNAVIEVVNAATGEQAAEFATPFVAPDVLAGYLIDIGNWYNKAFLVVEINNHGISVMDKIKTRYYNVYRREVFDKTTGGTKEVLGFKTTQVTKPILVDALEEAVRNQDVGVHSEECLKEMKTFVRTDETGKQGFGAEGNNHDDRVIALGLAWQGLRQMPKMQRPKTEAEKKLEEYMAQKQMEAYYPTGTQKPRGMHERYKIRSR